MIKNIGIVAVLVKNDQVLLAKRKNAYGAGFYGCPGGRPSDQESLEQTFQRELAEETGVKPMDYHLVGVVKEWQVKEFFIHFIFICQKWRGEVTNEEPNKAEPWQWFDLDKLPPNILPGHLAGIKSVADNLKELQVVEI